MGTILIQVNYQARDQWAGAVQSKPDGLHCPFIHIFALLTRVRGGVWKIKHQAIRMASQHHSRLHGLAQCDLNLKIDANAEDIETLNLSGRSGAVLGGSQRHQQQKGSEIQCEFHLSSRRAGVLFADP
jgi:hypothetical protein